MTFHCIGGEASVHMLVITRKHGPYLDEMGDLPEGVAKRTSEAAQEVAEKVCVAEYSYASGSNDGGDMRQEVFHLRVARRGRLEDGDDMSLRDDISRDTKEAMRSRERPRIEALRMLSAALKNGEIEKGRTLSGEEEMAILRRQLKQREESADAFRKAGREEQAQAEETEAEIVRGYLPAHLSDEEIRRVIDEAIDETGATSMRDMGAVMGRANALAGNRADGRRLSALARERLQG
jgi:uncharacterized protein